MSDRLFDLNSIGHTYVALLYTTQWVEFVYSYSYPQHNCTKGVIMKISMWGKAKWLDIICKWEQSLYINCVRGEPPVSQFEYAFRNFINPLWPPAATHDNEVDPIFFQSSFPSSLVVRWKLITPLCSLIIVIRHGERQPQPSRPKHNGLCKIKMDIKKVNQIQEQGASKSHVHCWYL